MDDTTNPERPPKSGGCQHSTTIVDDDYTVGADAERTAVLLEARHFRKVSRNEWRWFNAAIEVVEDRHRDVTTKS